MPTVETVRGPVDTADLGSVLMHEHVFVTGPELQQNYPGYRGEWDEDARVADAAAKLRECASRGIRTIVDPTVIGLGRDIPRVQRVNELAGLNIIVATGIYTYNDVPFQFIHTRPGPNDPMSAMFVSDIRDGIAGTGVKAAFLKCAIEAAGLTPGVERVMRAVAQAAVATGKPITVHTHAASESGLVAQKVFREEGVDLSRVVIGHSGDSTDLDYLTALADAGSYLGMDRFGLDRILPTGQRVATIAELVRRGYAERIVLAHDTSCYIDWFSEETRARVSPNWHFTHVSDDVLPALRSRGVTDEQIDTMLVANPRRYFEAHNA
jgi:phosphotriesterase-related protein